MSDERPLFLVGFMGSGKTAVGQRLSARLGWEFLDIDSLVEQREGRSVNSIFEESGEGYFREVEWQVLQSLAGRGRVVVATGGGLFLGVVQRQFIKRNGRSIWLDVGLDVARKRLGAGKGRPLWRTGKRLAQRAMFEKRRAAYALADLRVEASPGDPDGVAKKVLDRISVIFD